MSPSDREQRRHWRFDWRLLLFAGLFLPLLLSLAVWQLQRAQQKAEQMDGWQDEASAVRWEQSDPADLVTGQPVVLYGQYGNRNWLLDNRTREGRPGYEVLTPFQTGAGDRVLVNRGWVPAPRLREQLPEIEVPDRPQRILARVADYPEPPVLGAGKPDPDAGWPRRVQSLSRATASREVSDLSVRMVRLAGSSQPGAYQADWEPDLMGPQTHYGYALQWFSLAVVLVILTVVASYRRTGAQNANDNG